MKLQKHHITATIALALSAAVMVAASINFLAARNVPYGRCFLYVGKGPLAARLVSLRTSAPPNAARRAGGAFGSSGAFLRYQQRA